MSFCVLNHLTEAMNISTFWLVYIAGVFLSLLFSYLWVIIKNRRDLERL